MNSIDALTRAADDFMRVIELLRAEWFLTFIDDWTPRDIAAHLAWWNRNMIAASQSVRAGKTPAYYVDAANDYRNINAQAIAEFPATDRRILLAQLRATLDEFRQYLQTLAPNDWDSGVDVQHYRGGAATTQRIVQSLTGDYECHTQQIAQWRDAMMTNPPGEFFDVVNEANVVIGQAARTLVHQRGLWHRGANVFLFARDGKLLVQRRSQDKDTFPGALDCSVSEHLKVGESYNAAAMRGLHEELGVTGVALTPLIEFSLAYGERDNEISQLFHGIVEPETVRFDPVEIESVAYYRLEEVATMLETQPALFSRWFKQLLLWHFRKPNELRVLHTFQNLK